jgi:hypothetical protein
VKIGDLLKTAVFWVAAATTTAMKAAGISETSINFYQTMRRCKPEDSHLHTRRRENLRSHFGNLFIGEGKMKFMH